MEALTIHPQNDEQLKAIKSVLKALKIPFYKSPYNPEYVKKYLTHIIRFRATKS
jgi:hypothetical protein